MYMGGGKNKPMNMYKGKVYEEGGLLAALMKDPKQRAAAKKMLGSMEKGGMMKYEKGGVMNATGETRKGASPEDQAMAIIKQKGAERQAALQPFYDLESEVESRVKKYKENQERLSVLSKGGSAYKRMIQKLNREREDIRNLLQDDRMNIEGVSDVERSNIRRMMPK